ncbi:MAG: 23S rRNA (guanosine(2251)-2'-O)-methyltransferase RlmB [Desulfobulbaceae bacterium]|nr:MAG: 23S rRNA (guanosine(2251)-2'-O)-methyltransferase RlmB [Desulfobulbaceae bacterium]
MSDDLVWGVHPVLEFVQQNPDRVNELIIQKDRRGKPITQLLDLAKSHGIRYAMVDRIRVTGNKEEPVRHQGVVARGTAVEIRPLTQLLERFKHDIEQGMLPRILVCDSIQDPHNLGAIIRSSHAAGVNRILLTRDRSAPLGGTAAKAAAGALSLVEVYQAKNLADALKELKEAGGWVFGAVKDDDAQSLYQTDFQIPACIVVGNEGQGIRPLVRKQCDILLSIPMAGTLDSLNSSVAAAVILFEMHRQTLIENPS